MSNIEGVDPGLKRILGEVPVNELSYQFVMDALRDYKSPRAKLGRLLSSGALVRVKKGLYVLGSPFRRTSLSMELLANLIYGPSYVSLESALAMYGLIPEHVVNVTSVTIKQKKMFDTPFGSFSYVHTHPDRYSIGISLMEVSEVANALVATREKAVADTLVLRRGKLTSLVELERILFEDFRMDEEQLINLDWKKIKEIHQVLPHSALEFLLKWRGLR